MLLRISLSLAVVAACGSKKDDRSAVPAGSAAPVVTPRDAPVDAQIDAQVDAPGPPADGVVSPEDFVAHASAARAKWEGKRIVVTGLVEALGGPLVQVGRARCLMRAPADEKLLGKTVTATGTVAYTRMMAAGDRVIDAPELVDCVVTVRR